MRRALYACSLLLALVGACSAVDDFDKFHFVDDGGAGDQGQDLSPALPGFGEGCVDRCGSTNLTCVHMAGGLSFAGGMCTHACNPSLGIVACGDVPNAFCVDVQGTPLCLPRCDLSMGRDCRTGYDCCANGKVTTAGVCAPPDTNNVCH